jgi:hypothetical protein
MVYIYMYVCIYDYENNICGDRVPQPLQWNYTRSSNQTYTRAVDAIKPAPLQRAWTGCVKQKLNIKHLFSQHETYGEDTG